MDHFTIVNHPTPVNGRPTVRAEAWSKERGIFGHLTVTWQGEWVLDGILVHDWAQRRGIATRLLRLVEEHLEVEILSTSTRTLAGNAWWDEVQAGRLV